MKMTYRVPGSCLRLVIALAVLWPGLAAQALTGLRRAPVTVRPDQAVVLVPTACPGSVRFAAEELARHLGTVTGGTIPVRPDTAPATPGAYLFRVGVRAPTDEQTLAPEEARYVVAESATWLQTVKVKPGERYLCVCWIKVEPAGSSVGAGLTIRFRDAAGAWAKRDTEPKLPAGDGVADWQPLVLLVTVPEDAGGLVMMPGATDQAPNATALFDQAAVYRIEPAR